MEQLLRVPFSLQHRDRLILTALRGPIELIHLDQVAAWQWSHTSEPKRFARRRLNKLVNAKQLDVQLVRAELLEVTRPLFRWNPGDPRPDFDAISWAASRRWAGEKDMTVYVASEKAREFFGTGGEPRA